MEHISDIDLTCKATPVAVGDWVEGDQNKCGKLRTGIVYKKTRSTLALNAHDLAELKDDQAVETFEHLMRLCNIHERAEIVIECLDTYSINGEYQSLQDYFNALQTDITRAGRKMNLYPPRIALEKRGQHFDLRVYPTFH